MSSGDASILVLERNPVVAQRLSRVLSAGAGLAAVHVGERPLELKERLGARTVLVALDAQDVDVALEWVRGPYPHLQIAAWSQTSAQSALQVARHERQLNALIGWPAHQSIPRTWELALVARRALDPRDAKSPRLQELLAWGATVIKWSPRTITERDHVISEIEKCATQAGASPRLVERLAVSAHELLMNAMYDAPVDSVGRPLYAADRRKELVLSDKEAPTLRLGLDGMTAGLEVTDPFGRLERKHVLEGIARGLAGKQDASAQVLDTSQGGAGLGLFRLHEASTAMLVEVRKNRSTRLLTLFDMDASAREVRAVPPSLHLHFEDERSP